MSEPGERYRYVTVRETVHERVASYRSANPRTEILVYKNGSWVAEDPGCPWDPFQSSGASWCEAEDHEEWFLHDASGNRLVSSGYPELRAMNIADPGYRASWMANVLARLADAHGDGSGVRWNGVYIDDVNLNPSHGIEGRIAELSDEDYAQETVEFVAAAANELKSRGYTVMANVAVDPWSDQQRALLAELAVDLDVVNREYFARYGDGNGDEPLFTHPEAGGGSDWAIEQKMMRSVQRAGAGYQAMVYGERADRRAQVYGRASFLLAFKLGSGSAFAFRTLDGEPGAGPWQREIGTPSGRKRAVGVGYMRRFSDGLALVNPHPESRQRFEFGPRRYWRSGRCRSSLVLGPARGAVLGDCAKR